MKYTHPCQIMRDGLILATILMILQALLSSLFLPAPPVAAPASPLPGCGDQPGIEFTMLASDVPTPAAHTVMEDDAFEELSTMVECYPIPTRQENQFLDLPTPLHNVIMVCAPGTEAIISSTSERDPAWKEERVHRFLSLHLYPDECHQVQHALNLYDVPSSSPGFPHRDLASKCDLGRMDLGKRGEHLAKTTIF